MVGKPASAPHLPEPAHSWFLSKKLIGGRVVIMVDLSPGQWTRSDQRHFTSNYMPELRQLVHGIAAAYRSKPACHTRVLRNLLRGVPSCLNRKLFHEAGPLRSRAVP